MTWEFCIFDLSLFGLVHYSGAQTITEAHMAAMMPRLLPPAWRGKPLVPWRPLAPAPAPGMCIYIWNSRLETILFIITMRGWKKMTGMIAQICEINGWLSF